MAERHRRLALAAIVLLALVLRLAGIGDRLSADEGYSWLVASAPDLGTLLDRLAAYENTPPLLYLLLAPLPLDDEVWLRLPVLIASVGAVPVLYAIVRPLLGTKAALLAALGLAAAPYHVSFANYSRAFALAGLGLLLALWAAARLAQAGRRRWWWLYAAGAVLALYSEYDAGLFLAALVGALLVLGTPPRRETLAFGIAPALALLPWLPELVRSLDALDETKVSPIYPGPGPAALRDVATALAFGEHGAADTAGARWVQLLLLAGLIGAALWLLRPGREGGFGTFGRYERPNLPTPPAENGRIALWLLAGTAAGTLVLHALVALVGPDVFAQRYLTVLIPLAVALLAAGACALPPPVPAITAAVLVFAATAVFAERYDRELEPDVPAAVSAAETLGAERILTNSAVVSYYAREGPPTQLDRPFGLGRGAEPRRPKRRIAVIDDARVAGGARRGPGESLAFGPIEVRLVTQASGTGRGFRDGRSEREVRLLTLACTLALLTAGPGGQEPPPETSPPRSLPVVVQDDAEFLHGSDGQVRRAIEKVIELGADRLRLTAGWSEIAPEPKSRRRPAFEARDPAAYPSGGWRVLDRAVRIAKEEGIEVQLDAAFWAPRWAVKRSSAGRRSPTTRERWQPNANEFGQFVEAVARRYNGDFPDPHGGGKLPAVRLWTTWNEPNHPTFLLPQWRRTRRGLRPASPHVYRGLHNAAYGSLKRVSGENQVLLGGLSSRGGGRPGERRGMPPLQFMRELACVDRRLAPLKTRECARFEALRGDGFAYHPYSFHTAPAAPSANPDEAGIGDLDRLTGLLGELAARGRLANPMGLHITEFGYETNPPDTVRGVTPEQQAAYHGQSTYLAWRNAGTRSFAQFLLRDLGPDDRYGEGNPRRWRDYQTGLLYADGAEKPSLAAFKMPFHVEARTTGSTNHVLAFGQIRPGSGRRIAGIEVRGPDGSWSLVPSIETKSPSNEDCGTTEPEFLTDSEGFFVRVLPYSGEVAYRLRWKRADGTVEHGTELTVGRPLDVPTPPELEEG